MTSAIEPDLPSQADVTRDAVALARAWLTEDHDATAAILGNTDPLYLAVELVDLAVTCMKAACGLDDSRVVKFLDWYQGKLRADAAGEQE